MVRRFFGWMIQQASRLLDRMSEWFYKERRWFTVYRNGMAVDAVRAIDASEAIEFAMHRNPFKDDDFMEIIVASHKTEIYTARFQREFRNEEIASLRSILDAPVREKRALPRRSA